MPGDEKTQTDYNRPSIRDEATEFLRDDLLGREDWKRSKFGYLSGLGPMASSITALGKHGNDAANRTLSVAKKAFGFGKKVNVLPTDSDDPKARFELAQELYGRSDEDVDRIARATRNSAYTWIFILLALTYWAAFVLPGWSQGNTISAILFPWVAHLFVIPKTFAACFHAWQLRTRRLGSILEFVRSPGAWIPPVSTSVAGLVVAGLGVAFLALVPDMALASETTSEEAKATFLRFVEEADDGQKIWYQLLQLLAPVGPIEPAFLTSPWAVPLGNAFHMFNTMLLGVGAAMIGWHTVVGTVATAQQGQVLGKAWNEIWAPIRVFAGVGTLVPMASGYSAVQLLVLQVSLWGAAMADGVWASYTDTFRDRTYMAALIQGRDGEGTGRKNYDAAIEELVHNEQGREAIFALTERQVCLAGVAEAMELTNDLIDIRSPGSKVHDLGNPTDDEWARFMSEFQVTAPGFATMVTKDGAAGTLTPIEVMTGRVEHHVGLSKDRKRITTHVGPPASGKGTQLLVNEGATPIVYWDFGLCGSVEIDAYDIKAVETKLATDPSQYTSPRALDSNKWMNVLAGDGGGYRRPCGKEVSVLGADVCLYRTAPDFEDISQVHEEIVQADLDLHRQAYDLIMSSVERIGNSMDEQVMPKTADVARLVFNSSVRAISDESIDHAAAEETLYERDGPAIQMLAEAYQRYIDIAEIERASATGSIYALIDNPSFDGFIDMSQEQGWASAGSLYMIIARMQEINYNLDTIALNFDGGIYAKERAIAGRGASVERTAFKPGVLNEDIHQVFYGEKGLIEQWSRYKDSAFSTVSANPRTLAAEFRRANIADDGFLTSVFPDSDFVESIDDHTEELQHFFSEIADNIFDFMLQLEPDPYFALVELVDLGQVIVTTATIIIGLGIFGSVVGGAKMKVFDAVSGGKMAALLGLVQMVGLILLIIGLVHAYIIPMVPYFMWMFFVLGMLILVAEAMVAAPIWAFMHIRLEGEEYISQVQRPGYMIVFNLFLRPTLAIFGLILSFSVFSAGIWFMNMTFSIAARGAMSEGTTLVGVISMLMIMTYMHYQIAMRSFKLINELPDRVTRWFGQGGENLGETQEADRTTGLFISNSEHRLREGGQTLGMMRNGRHDGDGDQNENNSGTEGPEPKTLKTKK